MAERAGTVWFRHICARSSTFGGSGFGLWLSSRVLLGLRSLYIGRGREGVPDFNLSEDLIGVELLEKKPPLV